MFIAKNTQVESRGTAPQAAPLTMQDANVVGTIPTPPYEYSAHTGEYNWVDFRLPSLTTTAVPKQPMFEEAELFHSLCNSLHFAEDFKRTSQTSLLTDTPVTSPEQPQREEAQQRFGTTTASLGLVGDTAEWFQRRTARDPPLQGLVEETSSLVPGVSEKSRQNSSSPSMYDEVAGFTASCRPETPGERRTSSEATEEHDEWAIEDVAVSAEGWPSASSPADAAAADSAAGRESAERHGRNSGSLSGVSEDAASRGGNATSASPNAIAQNVSAASTESLLGTVTPDLEEDVESETEEEQVLLPSDPSQWNGSDIRVWLSWVTGKFGLPALDAAKFPDNGEALCALTTEQFLERTDARSAKILNDFLALRKKDAGLIKGPALDGPFSHDSGDRPKKTRRRTRRPSASLAGRRALLPMEATSTIRRSRPVSAPNRLQARAKLTPSPPRGLRHLTPFKCSGLQAQGSHHKVADRSSCGSFCWSSSRTAATPTASPGRDKTASSSSSTRTKWPGAGASGRASPT
ncbi:uncharacterized protein LOC119171570 isoform X3 [Rhipicephalus microplus]|uniref:uncharacterized protein LOC119171570 isoform X3 n=1 Tax=Rhipicephalus microplus TaxID=6941 RepID=UPI003F6C91F2